MTVGNICSSFPCVASPWVSVLCRIFFSFIYSSHINCLISLVHCLVGFPWHHLPSKYSYFHVPHAQSTVASTMLLQLFNIYLFIFILFYFVVLIHWCIVLSMIFKKNRSIWNVVQRHWYWRKILCITYICTDVYVVNAVKHPIYHLIFLLSTLSSM